MRRCQISPTVARNNLEDFPASNCRTRSDENHFMRFDTQLLQIVNPGAKSSQPLVKNRREKKMGGTVNPSRPSIQNKLTLNDRKAEVSMRSDRESRHIRTLSSD